MNSSPTPPVGIKKPLSPAVLPSNGDIQTTERAAKVNPPTAQPQIVPKIAGYGMPCANCKTYYAADLKACPVCKGGERVSPTAVPARSTVSAAELCPDPIALEEERERFLREFKSQVFASQLPVNGNPSMRCVLEEEHLSGPEPAAICQGCYDHLQERVDVLEAAMHMDLKEAAQIVYDAVWADPSDPTKTYENAAHALLAELRKRSGVAQVFGLLQPLSD
ncbi:MAG TPA: hypothetical protein VNZ03_26920 [Terriglobales bacterium]|nr:hypothetical protein [Terriglobales bacterium]